MRDYNKETENRVAFIREVLRESGATGIVFGNSGGKDAAIVGILCKKACEDTVGVLMPCVSKRNFESDKEDALKVSDMFGIKSRLVDLTELKLLTERILGPHTELSSAASANIAPRLRMISLYAIAASENRLVAGTGNRSERHMGYFTKWGDGACDFNPIADLTVTEIYEFLAHLGAPESIIKKAPSAGLFEGQTDEAEMGISYAAIDGFLLRGEANPEDKAKIDRFHNASEHKRRMPKAYNE